MIFNEENLVLLTEILSAIRKHENGRAKDRKDVEDVLQALKVAGYTILPTGVVDGIRKLLEGRK